MTPAQLHLFELFPKLFHKNSNIFDERLFELIILFLNKGGSYLFESEPALRVLVDICIESLFVRLDREKITECNPCQGVLILQTLIILLPTSLTSSLWNDITENLYRRLTSNQFIKFTFLKSNIVSCLALSLLNNPYMSS